MLKNLDQFRSVSRDLTQGTLTGGILTAVAYATLLLLLISELSSFLRTTHQTNVVVDPNAESSISINFNVELFDLPCKYLKVGVWDKLGTEKIVGNELLRYETVPRDGRPGVMYSKEQIAALEQVDIKMDVTDAEKKEFDADWSSSDDHFKHNDLHAAVTFHDFTIVNFFAEWCVHCRQFSPTWMEASNKVNEKMQFTDADGKQRTVKFLKINCVDFGQHCKDAKIAAFPTVRLYKFDGTFGAFQAKRTVDNIVDFLSTSIRSSHLIATTHHAMFSEGCKVQGSLNVPRVQGHFYLMAEAFGDVQVNPAYTNVSHLVHHLSFGEASSKNQAQRWKIPKEMYNSINPLDGKKFIVERFHEAPQHYLKVVSTHLRPQSQSAIIYQMTHSDRVRNLRREHKEDGAPQARFTYDFSAMSVVVKVKSKRWYEFVTSLFAILGGTYTIVELCSGTVDRVGSTMKGALGKAE